MFLYIGLIIKTICYCVYLINRYNKTLAETEKVNKRLDKELGKYNDKIDSIEKELDLTPLEREYLKGEDIFTGSTRSFFKQGL